MTSEQEPGYCATHFGKNNFPVEPSFHEGIDAMANFGFVLEKTRYM